MGKKKDAERARLEDERRQRLAYEESYANECNAMERAKKDANHRFANDLLHQIEDNNKQHARQEALEKQAPNMGMDFNEYARQLDEAERNQKKEYADALKRQIEAKRAKGDNGADGMIEFVDTEQMYYDY